MNNTHLFCLYAKYATANKPRNFILSEYSGAFNVRVTVSNSGFGAPVCILPRRSCRRRLSKKLDRK